MALLKPSVKRKLEKRDILGAAFDLFAREGETGFSIRKLGAEIGVDPMTVLHHFRSKDELLRAIADHAVQRVEVPVATSSWQNDLRAVANSYRTLAHRHPRIFPLHFRYNATGPADHVTSEIVYCAMRRAGLADDEAAGLALAFYAFVLGFALAESEGLLRPIGESDVTELNALDPDAYKSTRALVPALKVLDPDAAFKTSMDVFIAGVAERSKRRPPQTANKAKSGSPRKNDTAR
jgi:AcrR family transcriptional regulator